MNTPKNEGFSEVYQDLVDFKETKKSINALLEYRRALIDKEGSDFEKIALIKVKAMEAIDNLFADDNTEKTS